MPSQQQPGTEDDTNGSDRTLNGGTVTLKPTTNYNHSFTLMDLITHHSLALLLTHDKLPSLIHTHGPHYSLIHSLTSLLILTCFPLVFKTRIKASLFVRCYSTVR